MCYPEGEAIPGVRESLPDPVITADRDVYVVDFSYNRELTLTLKQQCRNLVILDHHETANNALADLPYFVYRSDVSGARIAWDFFFPGEDVPRLVAAVSDADTWQWKLPDTDLILLASENIAHDPAHWRDFLYELADDAKFAQICTDMVSVLRWKNAKIERTIRAYAFSADIDGHIVPALNSSIWKSEYGAAMSAGHPFALVYSGEGTRWHWSLRSNDSGLDVRQIAEQHGGGGHRNSASFVSDCPPKRHRPAADGDKS